MKNIVLIVCLAVTVGLLGWWFVSVTSQTDIVDREATSLTSADASVLVTPQPNSNVVVVQKATLSQPGFLVLREVIDGTAAQIVEISSYLETGTHTDIRIPVGEFYTGDAELIVVVYGDAGNDQVLNDFDQPFINKDGTSVATYVATGLSVADEVLKSRQAELPVGISLGDMSMPTVTYTNSGFEPELLEVKKGSMVHFVNESDTQMWVASDSHPAHDILPTFDQFKTGDLYMYIFEESGEWAYHDHLNAAFTGVIKVIN